MNIVFFLLLLLLPLAFSLGDVADLREIGDVAFRRYEIATDKNGTIRPRLVCLGEIDFCAKFGFEEAICRVESWQEVGLPYWHCDVADSVTQEEHTAFHECCTWHIRKPVCDPYGESKSLFWTNSCYLQYYIVHKNHPMIEDGVNRKPAERTLIPYKDLKHLVFRRDKMTLNRRFPEGPQIICPDKGPCPEEVHCRKVGWVGEKIMWKCSAIPGDYKDLKCEGGGDPVQGVPCERAVDEGDVWCERYPDADGPDIVDGSCRFAVKEKYSWPQEESPPQKDEYDAEEDDAEEDYWNAPLGRRVEHALLVGLVLFCMCGLPGACCIACFCSVFKEFVMPWKALSPEEKAEDEKNMKIAKKVDELEDEWEKKDTELEDEYEKKDAEVETEYEKKRVVLEETYEKAKKELEKTYDEMQEQVKKGTDESATPV